MPKCLREDPDGRQRLSERAATDLNALVSMKCADKHFRICSTKHSDFFQNLKICTTMHFPLSCRGAVPVAASIMASFLKQLYANWSRYVRGCGIESASVLVALTLARWFLAFL